MSGYIIQTALAETFSTEVRPGIEPDAFWEAIRQGALERRRTFDALHHNFLSGKFDPPDFALKLAHKDVALACQIGGEYSVPMKLAHITLAELAKVINPGWGTLNSPSATLLQSEDAGV